MSGNKIIMNIEDLHQSIIGANHLFKSLQSLDFQMRLRTALQEGPTSEQIRQEFMENNFDFLVGSLGVCSGVIGIIADGIINGSLELSITEDD